MTTYYISYTEGNNSNDGLSQEYPKKTLGVSDNGLLSIIFKAILAEGGHTLLFKKGDDWTLDSTTAWQMGANNGDYNIISTYGEGNNPILPRLTLYEVNSAKKYKFYNIDFYSNYVIPYYHSLNLTSEYNQFYNCNFIMLDIIGIGNTVQVYDNASFNLFDNCNFYNGSDAGISLNSAHYNIIRNCNSINCKYNGAIIYNNSTGNKLYGNNFSSTEVNFGAGIEIGWNNPHDNEIYNNIIQGNNYALLISGSNNLIYNNIVLTDYAGIVITANPDPATDIRICNKNKIFNNSVYANLFPLSYSRYLGENELAYDNLIYNNLFYRENTGYLIGIHSAIGAFPSSIKADYNLYYAKDYYFKCYNGLTSSNIESLEDYRSLFNIDKHSIYIDPKLKSLATLETYFNSPVEMKAIRFNKYFNIDYNNTTRGNKWDIGAYLSIKLTSSFNNIKINNIKCE